MTNQLSKIVINSFVTCKDITEITHLLPPLTLNISDIIKLANDKNIKNMIEKGSSCVILLRQANQFG